MTEGWWPNEQTNDHLAPGKPYTPLGLRAAVSATRRVLVEAIRAGPSGR